jgi:hypothetical protein
VQTWWECAQITTVCSSSKPWYGKKPLSARTDADMLVLGIRSV